MARSDVLVWAIDPGDTCGLAIGYAGKIDLTVQLPPYELCLRLSNTSGVGRVVVEHFDPRRLDPDAVRTIKLIGALEWLAAFKAIPSAKVLPANKKKTLRKVEDIKGRHARDAAAILIWDYNYGKWE